MFGIDSTEFLVIVIIAVIVIGPKDLPRALYKVGQLVGKAQGMARHFRTGIDAMVREVELEELEKKWAAQNKRIMDEHPAQDGDSAALPAPDGSSGEGVSGAEANPVFVAQSAPVESAPVEETPPYVAQSAADDGQADTPSPVAADPGATPAVNGPPYLAQAGAAKNDAAA